MEAGGRCLNVCKKLTINGKARLVPKYRYVEQVLSGQPLVTLVSHQGCPLQQLSRFPAHSLVFVRKELMWRVNWQ